MTKGATINCDVLQMPEPGDSWDGVYDATEHRASCPFYCMIQKGLIGEEDCLYLNIYTPVLDKEARKAVMVWFHPGVWNSGLSSDILFGPDFLIEDDVLVVTVSFRLGALGKSLEHKRLTWTLSPSTFLIMNLHKKFITSLCIIWKIE